MNIEVDFEVFKALTALRSREEVSYNDVLRDMLKLGNLPSQEAPPSDAVPVSTYSNPPRVDSGATGFYWKNVKFPAGMELRAHHKNQTIFGKIAGNSFQVNGKPYDSPSAAAVAVTGTSVNGWKFWECRLPGESKWRPIDSLRHRD